MSVIRKYRIRWYVIDNGMVMSLVAKRSPLHDDEKTLTYSITTAIPLPKNEFIKEAMRYDAFKNAFENIEYEEYEKW